MWASDLEQRSQGRPQGDSGPEGGAVGSYGAIGGREFQAEGRTSSKALGQDRDLCEMESVLLLASFPELELHLAHNSVP